MKNLKKVLAVMTAVTAMAASTSAFAANIAEVTGDFAGEGNKYEGGKLTVVTPANADLAASDMTLLVLTEGADVDDPSTTVDESAIVDGEILYIDQGTAQFKDCGLKTDVLLGDVTKANGHIIKVGYHDKVSGKFAIAQGYIKVSAKATGKDIEIIWGDVTADGAVAVFDASAILNRNIGGQTTFTDAEENEFTIGEAYGNIVWGDVTADGAVAVFDASAILNRNIGGQTTFTDAEGNEFTIGETYTITVDAE